MTSFYIDDNFFENLSNVYICDKKMTRTSMGSGLCSENNMSLESLLCDDTDESKIHKFVYNKNDCFLEAFSKLYINNKKVKSTSLDVCNDYNASLDSLLCNDIDEPYMKKLVHNKNDLFLKNLKEIAILPSLKSILFNENEFVTKLSTCTKPQTYDSKKQQKCNENKSSLFFKSLTIQVKRKKHQQFKMQQIKRNLRLHEPNSWYSVNLLVSLANSKSIQMIKN